MASRLVIVRHGETEWSHSGRHTGRSDIPLDARGRARASALSRVLANWDYAAVYCSPLARARETCELAGFGGRAAMLDDLMEWRYGEYEGLTTAQIRASRPGWVLWRDGVIGGETLDDVAERADNVIALAHRISGTVLLFSHGHFLRVLTACWLQMAAIAAQRFELSTGSVSVLGHEREWTALVRWNIVAA